MKRIIESNAKINLGLNILEKMPNGYHSLDMIMAPIDLSDKMEINYTKEEGTLVIKTNKKDIPTDENNILYKIYNKFYEKTNLKKEKMEVYLEKNIPHEAGLGGGSSNGGFFLKELNKYYNNILSLEEMIDISKDIGADIPFFISNKTCRAKGIGEKLEEIENNLEGKLILIKPNFGISAGVAYNNYSKLKDKKDADIKKIIKALKENDKFEVLRNIENHLEQALVMTDKKTMNFEKELNERFNQRFCMSGSGSVYFTIVDEYDSSELFKKIKKVYKDCEVYLCNFL